MGHEFPQSAGLDSQLTGLLIRFFLISVESSSQIVLAATIICQTLRGSQLPYLISQNHSLLLNI